MTDKRQCVSCGAPIKAGATRCEYCGMEYEPDYWAGTLKYVPIHVGRRKLVTKTRVPDELLAIDQDMVAKSVRNDITKQLAEGLSEMVALRMEHDWMHNVTVVRGEVWVEEPDKRTAFEGW